VPLSLEFTDGKGDSGEFVTSDLIFEPDGRRWPCFHGEPKGQELSTVMSRLAAF